MIATLHTTTRQGVAPGLPFMEREPVFLLPAVTTGIRHADDCYLA